jgi:hypothetical protein
MRFNRACIEHFPHSVMKTFSFRLFAVAAAILLFAASENALAASSDLDGDGKSDLIFRNSTTGQISAWLMNGAASSATAGLVPPGNWTVTHTGDFNGDGKADILYRNDDGSVTLWLMNGLTAVGSVGLLGANPDWRVSHVADFNGDGRADILWRNSNGAVTLWLMDGTTVTSSMGLLGADANWRVSDVADFNGDGKADLLWRNTNGAVTLWLMNGTAIASTAGLLGADADWSVTHIADFNGDGKADLLWRNTNGAVTQWLMNGTNILSTAGLLGPDASWRVTDIGDFNSDGKADLLWRNTNGAITMWLMNGAVTLSAAGILGATTWIVVPSSTTPTLPVTTRKLPPVQATWSYNIGSTNTANLNGGATPTGTVISLDMIDVQTQAIARLKNAGKYIICYYSAGTSENYRSDAQSQRLLAPALNLGEVQTGSGGVWEGEKWLDIRGFASASSSNADVIRSVMGARLDLAKSKGCDAVEPDNVDAWANNVSQNAPPGTLAKAISAQAQLAYNRWTADAAHARGLSVLLKNDLDQVAELAPFYDGALNEECLAFNECPGLTPFRDAGKAIYVVDYQPVSFATTARKNTANLLHLNVILTDVDVNRLEPVARFGSW